MPHKNYHELEADSYYELGKKEGALFALQIKDAINYVKQYNKKRASNQLATTRQALPHLLEELQGCAQGAGVAFEDIWALSLEDEPTATNRCTTVVTNSGKLIAHNEDWEPDAKDDICIVKKSLPHLTIFELYDYTTLGGNSIAVNSNGFIQAINTLSHSDNNTAGIPRNTIGRWLSETSSPDRDFTRLSSLKRAAGYSHSFISIKGEIWNIETSALKQHIKKVTSPFVHTNHYLSSLHHLENDDNTCGTFDRYTFATRQCKEQMSPDSLKRVMSDTSQGRTVSLFNERTVARMIIDLVAMKSSVWLLREKEKGWVDYPLDFIV